MVGMRLHLDTDFAGDTDDAAALAMLLGWPDIELVGITTTADPDGTRAGYVHHLLSMASRDQIPVAVGAAISSTTGEPMGAVPDHDAYWGDAVVAPQPSSPGAALELLTVSIDRGASLVAIGPYTNLADLEAARPGILGATRLVVMGGWVTPLGPGFPAWGPAMDWNVQCDTQAALTVFDAAKDLTLVTLAATVRAPLRAAHLQRLMASGPIGQLLARQGRAHEADHHMTQLGLAHAGLPGDLLNFHHDPLACAVALGWPGATAVSLALRPVWSEGALRFEPADDGQVAGVVLDVDGPGFTETWLAAVERADSLRPTRS
jgi:purine nucleosidase